MRRFAALVAVGLVTCSKGAPSTVSGAPATPPDDQYEIGGGFAYRVLVWNCTVRNERIAIYQTCSEGCTGCSDWQIDRTLCSRGVGGAPVSGGSTSIERTIATSMATKTKHPIPAGYGWR